MGNWVIQRAVTPVSPVADGGSSSVTDGWNFKPNGSFEPSSWQQGCV